MTTPIRPLGPSLRYATAQVTRATGGTGSAGGRSGAAAGDEPWATPGTAQSGAADAWGGGSHGDDTPF